MQCATNCTSPDENSNSNSTVTFLSLIDLNPSDESCIYSTLMFIIKQANLMKIMVTSVAFDQHLWLKAVGIIEDANLPIVCCLGGFNTLMSFLGSLGNLMKGSGLEELFSQVYREHTVVHMISGIAILRALRAHFLAESALVTLLTKDTFDGRDDFKINFKDDKVIAEN